MEQLDRADAGARAVPLHRSSTTTGSRRTCSTRRASGCCRSPASSTHAAGRPIQELSTSDIKFPTHHALRRQGGDADARATTARCSRATRTRPTAPRPRRRTSAPTAPPPTPTPRSTTACCSATGSSPRRATSRPRSTPRSTATRSRARWSRRWSRPRAPAPRRCSATLRLRKKLLGLQTYHLYDSFVPIFRSDKTYPYEQARELALASVAPLGDDYVAEYRRFVSGGRIDVYENEGKKSGAYNAGVYGVGPYLLLNYNDTLDSVFTLAHEAGHAMHTVLSYENQPFVDRGLHDLRRRGGLDHQRALPAREAARADQRPEGALPAAAARGRFDRRHLLHAGACSPTSSCRRTAWSRRASR